MPATKQAPTRQAITLKGSTNLVTEFFKYAANTSVSANYCNARYELMLYFLAFCSSEAFTLLMTFTW